MEDMLHHTRAVSRGVEKGMVLADLWNLERFSTCKQCIEARLLQSDSSGCDVSEKEVTAVILKYIRE